LKPNPINDRYKKNKGRAFVGAEYLSDDEEEDEEKEAGVAGLVSCYRHGICYGVAKVRWFLYGRRRYPDAGLVHSTR
jgi:hypothetical protein